MAGFVEDRADPAGSLPVRPAHWVVLVAVAAGLLLGAIVCAAGLVGGAAHGAAHAAVVDGDATPTAHTDHAAHTSGPDSSHPGGHGEHSGDTSASGSHPGMACVVSVDLQFPNVSSPWDAGSHVSQPPPMTAGCSDDVDPPVPRIS